MAEWERRILLKRVVKNDDVSKRPHEEEDDDNDDVIVPDRQGASPWRPSHVWGLFQSFFRLRDATEFFAGIAIVCIHEYDELGDRLSHPDHYEMLRKLLET